MKIADGTVRLSATDLANHMACRHLTELDQASALGRIEPPPFYRPLLEILQKRGFLHEGAYLETLAEKGHQVVRIAGEDRERQTLDAMRQGIAVIAQAALAEGRWRGYADVLRKVSRSSKLGDWSYEVIDTKLARQTRGGTILQLCLYSQMVGEIQGCLPEQFHVVTPIERETFRTRDYMAYFRRARGHLEQAVGGKDEPHHYPEPVGHCEVCRWWKRCDNSRHADDHLSLVAGISRSQRRELEEHGVKTLEALAGVPLPLEWKPGRGSAASLEKAREQARVQLEGRRAGKPVHELLPVEPGDGLARLPEPSPGDVFFDIEGDAFVGLQGLEYLFGYVLLGLGGRSEYRCQWALTSNAEKRMFEEFIAFLGERIEQYPDLHIYHFAPYEPAALKRLMGKHATCAEALDALLRAERFVDLYAVVRQGLRASVERYSIKDLEVFFGYQRKIDLREATEALRAVEWPLELGVPQDVSAEAREQVQEYNKDDCVATLMLREWLESLRAEQLAAGVEIPRPVVAEKEPSEEISEWLAKLRVLEERLIAGLPEDSKNWAPDQKGRWILAKLLEYHRREDKVVWWEYFRLRDMPLDELLDEKSGVHGLKYLETVDGGTARCPIHRYRFPRQEYDLRRGSEIHCRDEKIGKLVAVDHQARTIDVKKLQRTRSVHAQAVFTHNRVRAGSVQDALERFAEWVADHGLYGPGEHRAARDLLLRRPPRLVFPRVGALQNRGEDTPAAAKRLALELDHGVLAAQGPPGSGKTYSGARVILELVKAGKKVGVTAVSHKVIRNLLDKTEAAAREEGLDVAIGQKVRRGTADPESSILELEDNEPMAEAISHGRLQVAGGTAWLWSSDKLTNAIDVLVVDEAGQMSLPVVLAASQSARNLVLLGDPQQLDQPQQGAHPDGTACSALEHLLGDETTMPDEAGLFLGMTWRLHPSICEYTSETFYQGRLRPKDGLERQILSGCGDFDGAGLWYQGVAHQGNQNASSEEAEKIKELLDRLTKGRWTDKNGKTKRLTKDDILIVAPYNAQVNLIAEHIKGVRVGTVDKFQGQEAPVVIYSMATSSPEEAPRGMDFLYSASRLNVATSRAQCACILVASPALFDPECRTPAQMKLANALCAYLEKCNDRESGTTLI